MQKLKHYEAKQKIVIHVGDERYPLKAPYPQSDYEFSDPLAGQMYDLIRKSDTDICDIASNLGFNADNIKQLKDHIFYNDHYLDRYQNQREKNPKYDRFEPNLAQALAQKRLEREIHSLDDILWIKHEFAENYHELRYV